jgi:choline dehydrogenase-like flavoprotein
MAATNYDVLIIGSGASGGMAAYTLTKKGINVDADATSGRFPE